MVFEPSLKALFIFAGQRDEKYLYDHYIWSALMVSDRAHIGRICTSMTFNLIQRRSCIPISPTLEDQMLALRRER